MTSMLSIQNIALGFGGWFAPVDLSAAGRDASDPQVTVDGQGNAVAVWSQNQRVQAAGRPAGEAWQAPVNLHPTDQNAVFPQVAVNARGDAVAVWINIGSRDFVQ